MQFSMIIVYRLPMYEVLEFLWRLPAYKASINNLTEEVRCMVGIESELIYASIHLLLVK